MLVHLHPLAVELQLQGKRPRVQPLDVDRIDGFGTQRIGRVNVHPPTAHERTPIFDDWPQTRRGWEVFVSLEDVGYLLSCKPVKLGQRSLSVPSSPPGQDKGVAYFGLLAAGLGAGRSLWVRYEGEWGRGSGYRDRVADTKELWFNATAQQEVERELFELIDREWGVLLTRLSEVTPI